MAEKSTRIQEGVSGEYVATRDAIEVDDGANARVIQLVDTSSRQIATWTAMRGTEATPIDADDAVDLDSFSETTLACGDKSTLVVAVAHVDSGGSVDITPISYTSTGVVTVHETKTTAVGTVAFTETLTGTYYPSPLLAWDMLGAYEVSLFISGLSASGEVYIRGAMI